MNRNDAIDALRGLAIVAVLLLHALPREALFDSFAVFHIWQAVPVFLILMGYTGVLARVTPLAAYAQRRAARLLVPIAVVWAASAVIAVAEGQFAWDPLLLAGRFPAEGPGNYFVSLAVLFALALPALRWVLDRSPVALVLACLALSVTHELVVAYLAYDGFLHSISLFRVLFCISLGMLLASGHRAARWIPLLLVVSLPYLIAMALQRHMPFMVKPWQSQAFFASAYPAVLVALGLRLRYPKLLGALGRASFHIFLFQILWFGHIDSLTTARLPGHVSLQVIVDVLICLAAGLLFARIDERFLQPRFRRAKAGVG